MKLTAKTYLIIGSAITVVMVLVILFQSRKKREAKALNKNKDRADQLGLNMDKVIGDARKIYEKLPYDWWKLYYTFTSVKNVLIQYDAVSFEVLQDLYQNMYGKNLKRDLIEFFKPEDLAEISHITLIV